MTNGIKTKRPRIKKQKKSVLVEKYIPNELANSKKIVPYPSKLVRLLTDHGHGPILED